MSEDKVENMGRESPAVLSQRQIGDIDRDIGRQPKTMPGLKMAALAMLACPIPTWLDPPPYFPAPRPKQTDEQRAAALQTAEDKRARRRAKRAKG